MQLFFTQLVLSTVFSLFTLSYFVCDLRRPNKQNEMPIPNQYYKYKSNSICDVFTTDPLNLF